MSGKFVPVQVWTCPEHDWPQREYDHDCDCDHCGWEPCPLCASAEWEDKLDESGQPVMRELGQFEQFLHANMQTVFDSHKSLILDSLGADVRIPIQGSDAA